MTTTDIETFVSLIRRVGAGLKSNVDIAKAVCDDLELNERQRTILMSLIVDQVRRRFRAETQALERKAWPSNPRPDAVVPVVGLTPTQARRKRHYVNPTRIDPTSLRVKFLETTFEVGGGRPRVRWADATVDDHKARIALLEKQIAGDKVTVDRHRKAIDLIGKFHAQCLGQLKEEELDGLEDE